MYSSTKSFPTLCLKIRLLKALKLKPGLLLANFTKYFFKVKFTYTEIFSNIYIMCNTTEHKKIKWRKQNNGTPQMIGFVLY